MDEGPGFPVPNVILYNQEAGQTRVIIEVCANRGLKSDLKKVIHLIEDDDYGILEGFAYDHKMHSWLRYQKGNGGVATASSYSEFMGVGTGGMV